MAISWRYGGVLITAMVCIIYLHTGEKILGSSRSDSIRRLKQIEWGRVFGSSANTNGGFPKMDCQYAGSAICCSATQNIEKKIVKKQHSVHCSVIKEYYPSPYELRHLEKAEELTKTEDLHDRTTKFVDFIESTDEIEHAKKWLQRVRLRQEGKIVTETEDDLEYLSRFKVTRKCGSQNHTAWEYIEPLSVHGRHPFGLSECWHPHHRDKISIYDNKAPKVSLVSLDYLLLQSQHDMMGRGHGHGNTSSSLRHTSSSAIIPPSNVFVLDAGTSRFDSSLSWFVCAYQQVLPKPRPHPSLTLSFSAIAWICLGSNLWMGIHSART
jgi:hypothetical protein